MLCVYDFDRSPVSYDLMAALLHAQFLAKGSPVHVLFVPGNNNGWRTGDHKPIDDDERNWRLTHIIYPLCRLAGVTFTHAPSREWAARFFDAFKGGGHTPQTWTIDQPTYDYGLDRTVRIFASGFRPPWRVPERAAQHVENWIDHHMPGKSPIVSITLRETHTATRNSSVRAWQEAATTLRSTGLRVVFVRDTAKMTDPLEGDCPLASCDLEFRVALYNRCAVNLSRNGGPSMLPVYMGQNYLIFGILAEPYADPLTGRPHFTPTEKYMTNKGLPPGSQIHNDPAKRFVWESDSDPHVIVTETLRALTGELFDPIKNALLAGGIDKRESELEPMSDGGGKPLDDQAA